MYPLAKYLLYSTAALGLACFFPWLVFDHPACGQWLAIMATLGLAVGSRFSPVLCGFQFTFWTIAAVTAAMIFPAAFTHWGDFQLRNKWVLLIAIQLVMFGMGTQMSLHDFAGVAKAPRGVFVGILCHFTVMPLVGFGLTKIFHFQPEIAAGVILIGSCSSGLASNVMAYIAKSNLALSVTVTAVTTMLAPLATPLLMKLLAGTLVDIKFFNMFMDIVKIVLVPISAALLYDYLKSASAAGWKIVRAMTVFSVGWLVFLPLGGWGFFQANVADTTLAILAIFGFLLSAVVTGAVYHCLARRWTRLDRFMPVVAMAGIIYVTLVTTAAGRDNLLKVGGWLFLAAALHNLAGYFFGYILSRGAGLDKNSARSVAFEVGLQNGGMASGIAIAMGKLGTVGLAAAIFIPWMNVSGSVLANYWAKRPVAPISSEPD